MLLHSERYLRHLEGFDVSEADKARLIEQVWAIAVSCVDRVTGDAPEQILLGANGTKCPAREHDRLDSTSPLTSTFNDAAQEVAAGKTIP